MSIPAGLASPFSSRDPLHVRSVPVERLSQPGSKQRDVEDASRNGVQAIGRSSPGGNGGAAPTGETGGHRSGSWSWPWCPGKCF